MEGELGLIERAFEAGGDENIVLFHRGGDVEMGHFVFFAAERKGAFAEAKAA